MCADICGATFASSCISSHVCQCRAHWAAHHAQPCRGCTSRTTLQRHERSSPGPPIALHDAHLPVAAGREGVGRVAGSMKHGVVAATCFAVAHHGLVRRKLDDAHHNRPRFFDFECNRLLGEQYSLLSTAQRSQHRVQKPEPSVAHARHWSPPVWRHCRHCIQAEREAGSVCMSVAQRASMVGTVYIGLGTHCGHPSASAQAILMQLSGTTTAGPATCLVRGGDEVVASDAGRACGGIVGACARALDAVGDRAVGAGARGVSRRVETLRRQVTVKRV